MDQHEGIEFTVVDREGRALAVPTRDPEEAAGWLLRGRAGPESVAWRYGQGDVWRACPAGEVQAPLRCPEFREIQARAFRTISAHLRASEPERAAETLRRYCGYGPGLAEALALYVQLELAASLGDVVRCVDFAALARELVAARAVEIRVLADPGLPPGVFVFTAATTAGAGTEARWGS